MAELAERRPVRLIFLLPALVFAGLVLLFVVRLHTGDPSRVPSALIGRPVPPFALAALDLAILRLKRAGFPARPS